MKVMRNFNLLFLKFLRCYHYSQQPTQVSQQNHPQQKVHVSFFFFYSFNTIYSWFTDSYGQMHPTP